MSSQSILERSIDRVQEDAENIILKNAHYHILERRFALIKEINRDTVRHANKLLSFICTENCNLVAYINKVLIEGDGVDSTCFFTEEAEVIEQFSDYTQIFENNLELDA